KLLTRRSFGRLVLGHAQLPSLAILTGIYLVFFFNATATTDIYTLSLHDALPIYREPALGLPQACCARPQPFRHRPEEPRQGSDLDRKSTRLNSSHVAISYAVFCLKKKKATYRLSQSPERGASQNHR